MKKEKKFKIPHTYIIIFSLIVLSAIATFFIPGGEYNKETMEFSYVESQPQSWQVLTAFYHGFIRQAAIICFVLVIGAAFWVVNSCKAIDAGIYSFISYVERLERRPFIKKIGAGNVVIVLIMLLFSLFGAIFGMSEETIAFTIIIIPLAISLGYDSITGLAMVYVAAHVGFSGAFLNPFTIGVAQNIAEIPLFSGMEYRFFVWVVLNIITIAVVLWYAARVKRNPESSPLYQEDSFWRERVEQQREETIEYHTPKSGWIAYGIALIVLVLFSYFYPNTVVTIGNKSSNIPLLLPISTLAFAIIGYFSLKKSIHFFVLNMLFFTIYFLVVGVMGYSWYIGEISGLFLSLGILSGIAVGYGGNELIKKLVEGANDILSAALVVGLAAGIIIILEDAKVIDTILYSTSQAMKNVGREGSLAAMYGIQTVINLVMPSATAKAAITMPIMAPFSDMIGVSRQATVLAFQFGDGFTNMITPTSGVLIAVLTIARVPYAKWFKLILPFILLLIVLGYLLLLPTLYFDLTGF